MTQSFTMLRVFAPSFETLPALTVGGADVAHRADGAGAGMLIPAVAVASAALIVALLLTRWRPRLMPDAGLGDPRISGGGAWRLKAATVITLATGGIITALAVESASREEWHGARLEFDRRAARLLQDAQHWIRQPFYGLRGLRGVYAASKSVERDEFAAYVASRELEMEFPGARGFGFVERVGSAGREAFIERERADHAPEFAIRQPEAAPASAADGDLWVIKHVAPFQVLGDLWGVDAAGDPALRSAIESAVRTGTATVSGMVRMPIADVPGPCHFYFLPVYRNGSTPQSPGEREAALTGLVFMPANIRQASARALDRADNALDLSVSDATAGEVHARGDAAGAMFDTAGTANIGGREWRLAVRAKPAFEAHIDHSKSYLVAIGGAITTFLVGGIVWSLGSSRGRAERLAREMAGDFRRSQSALARTEARARSIIHAALDAIVLVDAEGVVTEWNPQAEAMFGWSANEAVGRLVHDLIIPDEYKAAHIAGLRRLRDSMKSDLVGRRIEVPAVRRDGSRLMIELAISAVRDEPGTVVFSAFLRDISLRKEAEAQVERARAEAEAASRSKSEFLANMSHEIRTPMTAILGYADVLAEDDPDALTGSQRLEYVNTIRRNGEHLLRILDDILDLSRIEAGKLSMERVPTDVQRLLQDVHALMLVRAADKGIALGLEIEGPLPSLIRTDPVRFRQIVMNLVGNAIKFTHAGGVRVRATTEVVNHAQPMLRIDVIDTGPGLTGEQMGRLFGAFAQADTSTTRKFGGTGLGLRISRSLARALGGDVVVSSEPGVGSTFTATIAAESMAEADTGELEGPVFSSEGAKAALPLAGVRVFLVEDGPDNQKLVSFHLRKAGAEVSVFENGRVALEALTNGGAAESGLRDPPPCDFVLTDMQMPEMDGYTLARTLRALGWRRPIVALTAHAMSGDAAKCIAAGCDWYATKPIKKERLIEICRMAVNQGEGERRVAA